MAAAVVLGQVGSDLVPRFGALPEPGGRPELAAAAPADVVREHRR